MPYITNTADLPAAHNLESAETAKAAILRPTRHFEIATGDNPDMIRTLALQEQFVDEALSASPPATEWEREQKKSELIRQFQQSLSDKAFAEQLNLIEKIKEQGVPVRLLVEDKGLLEKGDVDFYTDQIFATDTGQYYDAQGELHFIAAAFKNRQRQGEEALAVAQAGNLGATIHWLTNDEGKKLTFEGGDIRQMIGKKLFFIGQGHRSDPETAIAIAKLSSYYVLPVQLLQEQFYHLDCCFMPLPDDAAVIYEGEYQQDEHGQTLYDDRGWPVLCSGTETMTAESRALIRAVYPPEKLVLISRLEALAYATNAVILQNPHSGRFKLFVNGVPRTEEIQNDEQAALQAHRISYTAAHLERILALSGGHLDIIETPYSTMHGSGGSVRCTVLELACRKEALHPRQINAWHYSDALDRLEARLAHRAVRSPAFFQAEPGALATSSTADMPEHNPIPEPGK
ncbi:arginine deiminase-related protein [Legionella sp. CNM-4043-24]|uniref:arginine deiminase-related protein n=1 Tax=Legionella sp. CNM-4043-24 TaxID=3421646 RepID=UPI00403AE4B9